MLDDIIAEGAARSEIPSNPNSLIRDCINSKYR